MENTGEKHPKKPKKHQEKHAETPWETDSNGQETGKT